MLDIICSKLEFPPILRKLSCHKNLNHSDISWSFDGKELMVCYILVVPRLWLKRGILKLIGLSVRHKNFNLAHIFLSINDGALIFGMHDPCNKPFLLVPCGDLDLWPTSRSILLLGRELQFFEFARLQWHYAYPWDLPDVSDGTMPWPGQSCMTFKVRFVSCVGYQNSLNLLVSPFHTRL